MFIKLFKNSVEDLQSHMTVHPSEFGYVCKRVIPEDVTNVRYSFK